MLLCGILLTGLGVNPAQAQAEAIVIFDREGTALTEDDGPIYAAAREAFSYRLAAGCDAELTIDLDLQSEARELIMEAPEACAVVLDVNSGEPLALVSVGGFDPLNSVFSPGRLFTPCTALASMAAGLIDPTYAIPCEGVFTRYSVEGYAPECWIWNTVEGEHYTHAAEDLRGALRDNCDYYFYCLGNDLGIDELSAFASGMGLGQATGIELAETTGVLLGRGSKSDGQPWRIGDTLEASVGRSVSSCTPLQLARYCAVIANGGKAYSASVLLKASKDGEVVFTRESSPVSEVSSIDKACWDAVREGMFLNFNNYLSMQNDSYELDYSMAGLSEADGNGTELFMGYAPYEEPEIAVVVAVNDSSAGACRMACDIASAYFKLNR